MATAPPAAGSALRHRRLAELAQEELAAYKKKGANTSDASEDGAKMPRNLSFSGQFRLNATNVPAPVVNPFINESLTLTGYEWIKVLYFLCFIPSRTS
jgi:hypothetical protein